MNKIQYYISRILLWVWGKKYLNKDTHTFKDGNTEEIMIYKEKESLLIAQCIPLINVIILNEDLKKKYTKNLQEFIL